MHEHQGSPSRRDRSRAVKVIEQAHAEGRITGPDRNLRVESIDRASTRGEIEMTLRDLYPDPPAPAGPAPTAPAGGAAPHPVAGDRPLPGIREQLSGQLSPEMTDKVAPLLEQLTRGATSVSVTDVSTSQVRVAPQPRRATGLIVALGVLVMVIGGVVSALTGLGGSTQVTDDGWLEDLVVLEGGELPEGVVIEPDRSRPAPAEPAPAEPAESAAPGLSAAGMRATIAAVEERFGTTEVRQIVFRDDYSNLDVPLGNRARYQSWLWRDGAFTEFGPASSDPRGERIVDLADLRVGRLAERIEEAVATLGVEDPTSVYVIVGSVFSDSPQATVYVSNDFRETAMLTVDLAGREIRRMPVD